MEETVSMRIPEVSPFGYLPVKLIGKSLTDFCFPLLNQFGKLFMSLRRKKGRAMKTMLRLSILAAIVLAATTQAQASGETISALSCSQSDVQNAINSAVSGDTVLVPAGNCTWGAQVTLPAGKDIILKGAGVGKTVISGTAYRSILLSSGSRVSGFEIYQSAGTEIIKIESHASARFRVDNCKLEGPAESRKFFEIDGSATRSGQPFGLIDNCQIRNIKINLIGSSALYAWEMWAAPLDLGTDRHIYVEDNTFDYTTNFNAIDGNWGSRYTFRHNNVTNAWCEVHGNQGNTSRGVRAWEIYDNTFTYTPLYTAWQPVHFIRSGTGVVFNNVVTSTNSSMANFLGIDVRRAAAGISLGGNFRDGNEPIPTQGTGIHTGGNGEVVLTDSARPIILRPSERKRASGEDNFGLARRIIAKKALSKSPVLPLNLPILLSILIL